MCLFEKLLNRDNQFKYAWKSEKEVKEVSDKAFE